MKLMILTIYSLLLSLTGCSNPSTPAGHEGYVYEDPYIFGKGGFRGTVEGPANYGMSFYRNRVTNIDTRASTYTESFNILAKDDLNINFNFHAVLKVKQGKVQEVVEKYGAENWYQRYVKEPFRHYIRDAAQNYKSSDLKVHREEISQSVQTKLTTYLQDTPFQLINLVVGNMDYPEIVAKAVEKKLAAQQLLEEQETQKQITQKNAEIRVEEAKGIAEAQKIINQTLTSNYLQLEAIEAQKLMANSPNHTTVYIPVGTNGVPLVMSQNQGIKK